MSVDEGVEVAMSAINRRLRANGDDSIFLLLKVQGLKGTPDDLLADVEAARDAANAYMDRDGEELVWAGAVMPTLKGPVIDLDWIGTEEQNREWLDAFAEALTARGRIGTVTAAPIIGFPNSMADYFLETPVPTAQMAFTLSDPSTYGYPPMTWLVGEDATRHLAEHAARWTVQPEGVNFFRRDVAMLAVPDTGLADLFEEMAHRSAFGELTSVTANPARSRGVTINPLGRVSYSLGEDGGGWMEFVDDIRGSLRAHAALLDVGFVRYRLPSAPSFFLQDVPPELPGVGWYEYDHNRHLYPEYVPDAHAIQVLTQAHLDKASDLSAWKIEPLDNQRYLVEANDLRPWFEGATTPETWRYRIPDPELLAAARSDFGSMILTREMLIADERAWVEGRQFHPEIHTAPVWDPRR